MVKNVSYDVVVVGGGLAGLCAAVASARNGKSTCLVHNRPVLGGNSSSEIRVTPHGAAAFHAYARETGIISELLIQERAQNHEEIFENGWTNSIWDVVQYDLVQQTENLTLYLNTDFQKVIMHNERNIKAVEATVQNAEIELQIAGEIFVDCTGDGIVAHSAGCESRMGSEGRDEFNEPHAPEIPSGDVMGSSIHFKTKRLDYPAPFEAPEWAIHYEDASFFYENGRPPKEVRGGYWWLEIGVPFHTIYENEEIRHELTRHALGVWDWMKNRDPKMKELTKNYALDWIGQVPGKRESRRIMGQYLMTEHDPQQCTVFEDEVGFGGWFIDLHTPGGLLAQHSEPASGEDYNTFTEYAVKSYAGPYGVPLRCLIAKDVDNLMMAGRNVSVTHAALGTVRVMGTTALLGQAVGTAAAIALRQNIPVANLTQNVVNTIQQQLLRDGCFLLNSKNEDPKDLALQARVTSSSDALEYGAGPNDLGFHQGLSIWKDQPQYTDIELKTRRGQLIAVGTDQIDTITLCLSNHTASIQQLDIELLGVRDIWDYRIEELPVILKTRVDVPIGEQQWVDIPANLHGLNVGTFMRLDVLPNPQVSWPIAGKIITGHMASYQIGENKMRRFGSGHTLSYKITPGQPCYPAQNITNGVTRPAGFTNLWKSESTQGLPQWITLSWDQEIEIETIELTFPGHLIRELHAYSPFYRDPQCPKDYAIEAFIDGKWQLLLQVVDNYQRRRSHQLANAIRTNRLRVNVTATNGDPSAQIYEIRCYGVGNEC
ncbi:FAD-dependent oxidoreductase [Sphingobacterium chuzhouense]|uniref:FAD-dependent oxidoreductase n=1 Tax=Sphingobacterium chuzhouense TaxID=1742264 RepID=A0ABR7XUA4_9SPHI|nr:FAD-dependent oxidoreductase [Sphingobacterium chuzhouense]MBD1422613.1 FAD-dependent oxidoreductase [Sphingobacterium chuzhouense]